MIEVGLNKKGEGEFGMSQPVEAVKKNIDLTGSKALKIAFYDALRKTIILGEISAGTRINELEFSEELNISRTPIRFALQKLQKEDLVEHVPGSGMLVKGITIRDAHEIYDIRKALDTLATVKAMELMSSDETNELKELLEYGDQLNAENRVDELLENFSEFNNFIYDKSRMPRLKTIVNELQAYLVYFRDLSIRSNRRREYAIEEHWLIYRGIINKDVTQIELITQEHLDRSLTFIVEEMKEREIQDGY